MKEMKFLAVFATALALAPFLQAEESSDAAIQLAETVVAPEIVPATESVPAAPVVPEEEKNVKRISKDQKKQLEVRLVYARKARIDAEIALEKMRLTEKLARGNAERIRMETEADLRAARNADKLAEIEAAKRKLDATLARDKARADLALVERQNRLDDAEMAARFAKMEQDLTFARYNREISQVKMAEALRGVVPTLENIQYRKDPLEDGTLYISDRRIEFSGAVTPALAEYVVERIYFYNNQNSEYPIFIVIDRSPGGSVAAGYDILKAMESSKAPVYVVVKGYAASMAAMITSLAERSFCYENTVILHHQPSTGTTGNLTQIREKLEATEAWTRLLNDKIATRMGLTYPEYVREMYRNNSRGDWSEFGVEAKNLKWVTDVVDSMSETSVVRLEKNPEKAFAPGQVREYKFDEHGKPYIELPTLPVGDMWMIYDPNNLYRVVGA